jgi:large subunit ribosomal protein L25
MSLINAKKRDTSLNPRQVRAEGLVPATIYGSGMDSVSIQLDAKEFILAYRKDKNAIFELKVDKETYKAIVKKVQVESISDKVLNIEFQRIKADQKIKVVVPLEVFGESAAVKAGGSLVSNISVVEVECLPSNIPATIKVDISKLVEMEDSLTVQQIEFPKGVQPTGNTETVAVKVAAPKTSK